MRSRLSVNTDRKGRKGIQGWKRHPLEEDRETDNGPCCVRSCYSNPIVKIPALMPLAINICYFCRSIAFGRASPSRKQTTRESLHGRTWSWDPRRMRTLFQRSRGDVPETWRVCRNNRVSCCSLRSARRDEGFSHYRLIAYQLHVLIIPTPFYTRPNSDCRKLRYVQRTCFSADGEQIFFSYPRICICAQARKQARAKRFFEYPSFDASSRSLRADWLNSIAIRWDLCVNTSQRYRKS